MTVFLFASGALDGRRLAFDHWQVSGHDIHRLELGLGRFRGRQGGLLRRDRCHEAAAGHSGAGCAEKMSEHFIVFGVEFLDLPDPRVIQVMGADFRPPGLVSSHGPTRSCEHVEQLFNEVGVLHGKDHVVVFGILAEKVDEWGRMRVNRPLDVPVYFQIVDECFQVRRVGHAQFGQLFQGDFSVAQFPVVHNPVAPG